MKIRAAIAWVNDLLDVGIINPKGADFHLLDCTTVADVREFEGATLDECLKEMYKWFFMEDWTAQDSVSDWDIVDSEERRNPHSNPCDGIQSHTEYEDSDC